MYKETQQKQAQLCPKAAKRSDGPRRIFWKPKLIIGVYVPGISTRLLFARALEVAAATLRATRPLWPVWGPRLAKADTAAATYPRGACVFELDGVPNKDQKFRPSNFAAFWPLLLVGLHWGQLQHEGRHQPGVGRVSCRRSSRRPVALEAAMIDDE